MDLLVPCLYALGYAVLGIVVQLRFFPIGDIDLETDFYGDLVLAARNLAEGRFSVYDFAWKGPLYAFALMPMRWLTGDWYRGAVVLSAIAGGASLLVGYGLVRRLFDRRVALLSMIAASLVGEFFVQSHRASTDVLFLLLVLASMACSLLAGASRRRHAAAGGLAGLAFLTRYNGAFLVVGAALALFVANPDGMPRRRRLAALGAYVVAFLLVCAPWFVVNWMESGRILASRNLETVAVTFYGSPRWRDDPAAETRDLPALVARDPARFAAHFGRNLVGHATDNLRQLLGWPMALLPIAGILGLVLRPPTRRQTAFYLFALTYFGFMGLVFYTPRFFLPLILPCVAIGFGLVQDGGARPSRAALRRWLQVPGRRRAGWALVAVFGLGLGAVQARRVVAVERAIHARRPLYILDAARVLARPASESRPRLLARKGHIAYYAGFDFVPYSTSVNSLEDLVRYARSRQAEYVVYSMLEYSLLPRMLFLAVADAVPLLQEIYRAPSIRIFHLGDDTRTTLSAAERRGLLLANLRAARLQRRPAAVYLACEDLGRHHMQEQAFAEAEQAFQWALEAALQAGDDPELARFAVAARFNLAGAQLKLGRPEAAARILQENLAQAAAQESPLDLARNHARLGLAYEMLGRHEEALRERRLARAMDPQGGIAADPESLEVHRPAP